MEPSCCVWSGNGAVFLDAPKALMGLLSFGGPSALEQVESLGWIIPNSLCAWITQTQHHLLVLSPEPARKAFLLRRRKCLNRSFLHPYDTFNSATLEIYLVGAACPVAYKDALHPAVAFQGQLLGNHWPVSLAGDVLVVRLDTVLAEERQCMGWTLSDAEGECNTMGRWSYFFCLQKNSKLVLLDLWKCLWVPTYCRIIDNIHLVVSALECRGWSRSIWGVGFLF